MDISKLKEIFIKNSSNFSRQKGMEIFNNNLVGNIRGNRIENAYNIYGDVEQGASTHKIHIKLDLKKNILVKTSCNCESYKEISLYKKVVMCEHVNAVAYKFLYQVNKNNSRESNVSKDEKTKKSLSFEVKVEYKDWGKTNKYQLEFRIGDKHKKLIEDLTLFEKKYRYLADNFNSEDVEVFKYICKKIYEKGALINLNRNIEISHEEIKEFFHVLGERKISFKFNGIIYKCHIIRKNLPLSFTMKNMQGRIVLTTHKKLPIALDNNKQVYFYHDDIYIPSQEQLEKYQQFYTRFLKNPKIIYRGTVKNYKGLLRILNSISNDVSVWEDLSRYMKDKENEEEEDYLYTEDAIKVGFYEDTQNILLDFHIDGIDDDELSDIIESFNRKNTIYKTRRGKFIDFNEKGINNFFRLLKNLDFKDGSYRVYKNKNIYLSEMLKILDLRIGSGKNIIEKLEKGLEKLKSNPIEVPKEVNCNLREYQLQGYKWLKSLSELGFGGILADEMGLGKTIQTIVFLASEIEKRTLIITPTSLLYNWKSEFEKFAPNLNVGVISRGEDILEKVNKYDILLTTYGIVRNNYEEFNKGEFYYCIIDEGQNIKNYEAKNTIGVKNIKSKQRFILSGTPIENNLFEIWSLFDFIMPGYLFSLEEFKNRYITNYDLESIKMLIKPFILRRTKKEVLKDLPDKLEKKIVVSMTEEQTNVYKSYIHKIREDIKNSSKGNFEIFSYLTKLRQICLDPSIVLNDYHGGSGKLNVAIGLIRERIQENHKIILFSQFTSVLGKIKSPLENSGIKYLYLDGSVEGKERLKLVNKFNDSKEPMVFLISLKAGGTGLNLVSANTIIHFDPWWNPAVEDQATDRAHRIGQKNTVEVIKLIAKETIEEQILLLQESKRILIGEIITSDLKGSYNLGNLSKEDIMNIINRE